MRRKAKWVMNREQCLSPFHPCAFLMEPYYVFGVWGRTSNKGVKLPVSVRFFEHFYKAIKTYLHNTAGSRLVIV